MAVSSGRGVVQAPRKQLALIGDPSLSLFFLNLKFYETTSARTTSDSPSRFLFFHQQASSSPRQHGVAKEVSQEGEQGRAA
jgi:hypothetical protein